MIELITNILIFIEALIRIIAFGAFSDEGSYFDIWTSTDFLYLINYFAYQLVHIPQLEIFLYFIYFRPCKIIT